MAARQPSGSGLIVLLVARGHIILEAFLRRVRGRPASVPSLNIVEKNGGISRRGEASQEGKQCPRYTFPGPGIALCAASFQPGLPSKPCFVQLMKQVVLILAATVMLFASRELPRY